MTTLMCYTCILNVSRELYHYDEFLSLPVLQVCKLISSDRLTVTSEEQVSYAT